MEITRNDQIERLFLIEEIRKQATIAGRATTCWRAYCEGVDSKESLIVKDSSQYEERLERELIKKATNESVRNVARYSYHETVQVDEKNDDTSENVRQGLMKKCGRTAFKEKFFIDSGAPAPESSGQALAHQTQSRSSSRRRSLSSTREASPPAKRFCSSLRSINPKKSFHNRAHRRVITRDLGKPIYKASSRVAVI